MCRALGGQPHKTPHFHPRHRHPPEWPSQEEPRSSLTASAPVSDVSAPACTNGVWPPLRPVSVVQKNKPSTMLSSNVQSIDLPMECKAWRFWTMRQLNDCSTSAPRSSQNRCQKDFNRGALQFCGGIDIIKLTNTPLIYSVSRFNSGGLGVLFGGLSPPKPPPVATGLVVRPSSG